MLENKIKKLFSEGRRVYGATLLEPSNIIAKNTINAGIDFLWIDTEHTRYGVESLEMVPIICRLAGCVPVIRVAGLDSVLIKKALDIGAGAVMVPQVETAEQAKLAVQYAKYPPIGTRGVSPSWILYMDLSFDEYLPVANDENSLIVQIESAKGMENVEAIADVEGVDILMVGPVDLSASLGHIGQVNHPEVQRLIEDFPKRVAKTGKWSGAPARGYDQSKKYRDWGYQFINIGNILRGVDGLTQDLQKLRQP